MKPYLPIILSIPREQLAAYIAQEVRTAKLEVIDRIEKAWKTPTEGLEEIAQIRKELDHE